MLSFHSRPLRSRSPTQTTSSRSIQFEQECVGFFADVVHAFGIPKSVGQIYGLLYASPVPLSFSDIVEMLEISKGSTSQGLQLLRSLGAINVANPASTNGDVLRREYYEPELSLRRLVGGVLRERVAPLTARETDRLAELRALAEQEGDARDFCLDRVKQLETWRRRLKTVLPVLNTLLGPKSKK